MHVLSVQNLIQRVSVSPGQKKQCPAHRTQECVTIRTGHPGDSAAQGGVHAGCRDYAHAHEPGTVQPLKGRMISCASMKGECTKQ